MPLYAHNLNSVQWFVHISHLEQDLVKPEKLQKRPVAIMEGTEWFLYEKWWCKLRVFSLEKWQM